MSYRILRMCGQITACFLILLSSVAQAQNSNAALAGTVTDTSGAAVPGATVTITAQATGVSQNFIVDAGGLYSFPNLVPGSYQLRVTANGFDQYVQDELLVRVGYAMRQDVQLKVGSATEKVEVNGSASALNFENAEMRSGISPEAIQSVPLLVAGAIRSAANFITLLPGVANGTGDPGNTRFNGSQAQNGETILDGISTMNPSGDRGATGAILDFPQSPDIISEFQVLASSYLPQYGTTLGDIIIEKCSFWNQSVSWNRLRIQPQLGPQCDPVGGGQQSPWTSRMTLARTLEGRPRFPCYGREPPDLFLHKLRKVSGDGCCLSTGDLYSLDAGTSRKLYRLGRQLREFDSDL